MHKPQAIGVIWCDFIPMSLPCNTICEAMEKARVMREKIAAQGLFMDVRAVLVPEGSDTPIDLLPREVSSEELVVTHVS